MTSWRYLKPASSLMLTTGLCFCGFGLLSALLPLRAKIEQFSTLGISLLGIAFFVGFIFGCWFGPKLIERVQHPRTFVVFAALTLSTPMLHAIYIDELFWALLRFLCGIGISGMRMCLESWLNDLTHPKARILTVTCYIMILIGMSAFGQMLIQFIEIGSFEGFCYVALCFVFSIVCVGITKSPVPEVLPHHQLKSITFLARIAIPLMGCFTAGIINGPYWTYSSLFLLDRGFGLSASAWFMSSIVCGAAFAQIPAGTLAQRFGFLPTATLLCIIGIFCCIWISFELNLSLSALLVLGSLFGAANWPLYSLSVAEANKTLTPKDRVRVAGTLLMSYAVGSLIGSLIVSIITLAFGLSSFFIVMAFAQILMIGVLLYPNPSRHTTAEKAINANTALDTKVGPILFDTLDPDAIELSKVFR